MNSIYRNSYLMSSIFFHYFRIRDPTYSFSRFPGIAPTNITVECKEQVLAEGELPKWVWRTKDIDGNMRTMTEKPVPGCIDPTYCETNPPVPSVNGVPVDRSSSGRVNYKKPKRGSLSYKDGELVTYKCHNPSKLKSVSPYNLFSILFY